MQLKKLIQTIVLILAFTAQQINAKPRRVSIDEIQQLIKPKMQKIKNSQLRTLLSQDSVDDVFSFFLFGRGVNILVRRRRVLPNKSDS